MRVCIGGGSGLLGTALAKELRDLGHEVSILTRSKKTSPEKIHWDPSKGILDAEALEGSDVIINLAGDNVASGLWTKSKKTRIRESRLQSTALLSKTISELKAPPKVFINASAIGFYGDGGETPLTEISPAGDDFLANVCKEWENAALEHKNENTRRAQIRIGVVLSTKGGALAKALTPFKLGLGGRFGSGEQYFSWIGIDDAVRAILHIISKETLEGPINLTSPNPLTNAEYTAALAGSVQRPAFFHVPAWLLRFIFGEMGEELFLVSSLVIPEKLLGSGFAFLHFDAKDAISALLKENR